MYFPIIDVLKENFIAKIPSIVTQWLTDNVNPVGSAVVVDASLSISGAAADAKKTGDELSDLKSDLSAIAPFYYKKNVSATSRYSSIDITESFSSGDVVFVGNIDVDSNELDNVNYITVFGNTGSGYVEIYSFLLDDLSDIKELTISRSLVGVRVQLALTTAKSYAIPWSVFIATKRTDGIAELVFKNSTKQDNFLTAYTYPQVYGAVGDGVTDDTIAIQAAIDSGKRVVFPSGNYLITQPITINKSGTVIEGANFISWEGGGSPANIIVSESISSDALIQSVFLLTGNSNNLSISNLYITGNFRTRYGIYYSSTDEYFVYNLELKNLRITRCSQYGVYLNSAYLCTLQNIRSSRCTNGGFYLSGKTSGDYAAGGTTMQLLRCYADICNYGFRLERMNYSSLIDCACDSINVACYQLQNTNNVSLINCGSEGAKGVIVWLLSLNRATTIQGLSVIQLSPLASESTPDGIIVTDNAQNVVVSGITVTGNESAATRTYYIYNNEPQNTKIVVLDSSVPSAKCKTIDNGNIVFCSRAVLYDIANTPDFVGQFCVDSSGNAYIATKESNALTWKQLNFANT